MTPDLRPCILIMPASIVIISRTSEGHNIQRLCFSACPFFASFFVACDQNFKKDALTRKM
jgi:hypothetical protein